jgi:hypothetical protein
MVKIISNLKWINSSSNDVSFDFAPSKWNSLGDP